MRTASQPARHGVGWSGVVVAVALALALLVVSTPARAEFGIAAFDGQVTANQAGDAFTQAAGHPYAISTQIDFNTITHPTEGALWPEEPVKNIVVDLPPGLVGNPTAAPTCSLDELAQPDASYCPTGSQVGSGTITFNGGFVSPLVAVYNMEPPAGVPARFAFNASGTIITLDASLRSDSDYGLTVKVSNAPQAFAIAGTSLTFWGFPADPSHDPERLCRGADFLTFGCSTESPVRPFLRNPTACTPAGVGLETRLRVDSWDDPGDFKSASFFTHLPPNHPNPPGTQQGPANCDLVPFDASLGGVPATPVRANKPSGFSFDLAIPQNDDEISQSDLKKAVVTLPEDLRVSPPSAHGLKGCSPAEVGLTSLADVSCPDGSKIGSLTIETPLLEEELTGSVYLATPFDNPSDTLLALYLVAKGPGLIVKLPGRVDADQVTGQLTATFDNNPQLPFSNLHLEFDDGDRAALVLPRECGTHRTRAELTGWSGKTTVSESKFEVEVDSEGKPCASGPVFSPSFQAGTVNPVAGTHSSFVLNLSRDDTDEELRTLTVDMPAGILARINGVPKCGAAQAAAGTCDESSRVGSVTTGAGAGPDPFYVSGTAYFAGPYKGGPFSLSIVVPVKAGPFDLGNVVVRAAIHIDRKTTALKVVSDPLPTILQGIPLQVRDVRVLIDRERFILNPTSCREKTIGGTIGSTEGTIARVSDRFQVGDCGRLPLRPKMVLRVGAKGKTHERASTPLVATLTQSPGQAGLKSVGVSLPLILNGRLPVIKDACTIEQFEADAAKNCAKARTGVAVARTPLLAEPLRGSVYFVETESGRGLPNLVVALRGEVDVDLTGKIKIPSSNRLGTAFETVPDVPITKFTLKLFSGRNGALGTTGNLCSKRGRNATATVKFVGQNGKRITSEQRLVIAGCKQKSKR